jgi:hypothetical protein
MRRRSQINFFTLAGMVVQTERDIDLPGKSAVLSKTRQNHEHFILMGLVERDLSSQEDLVAAIFFRLVHSTVSTIDPFCHGV